MDWILAVPAIVVALILLVGPGLLILLPWRLGIVARLSLAGLCGVFAVGVAGVLSGITSVPWAPWQMLVPWFLGGAVSWIALRTRLRRFVGPRQPWSWQFLFAWVAAGVIAAGVAFWAVPDPERVSQTYDNVFHMSAIAAILSGRDPSSLTLRTLIETGNATGYYPAGWHTLAATVVQLTGVEPTVAVNGLWIAVVVGLWIPGVVWLTQVLVPTYPRAVVVGTAIPLSIAFAAMPYGLLTWGTLYPTFLATALLPAAVAAPLVALRLYRSREDSDRRSVVVLGALVTSVALGAILFAQPRVLASWAVVLLPAAAVGLWSITRSGWRQGRRGRRRVIWGWTAAVLALLSGAVLAFVFAVRALGLFERPIEDRLGGPQAAATQSVWGGLWQVATQSWPTGVGGTVTFAAVPVAIAAAVGIVLAFRHRQSRWILVSYALVAVLYALAAGSDDVVSKLATAVWYKDRYRLSSVVVMLSVVLATWGVLGAVRWIRKTYARTDSDSARAVIWTAWAAASTSAIIIGTSGVAESSSVVFRLPEEAAGAAVVSAEQIEFFRGLEDDVPAGQLILGDPWDGSAWTQLYGNREPVFPHVNGQWDVDRWALAQRLQDIESDPSVCAALDKLNVRYVVFSRHELGGGDPAGNLFPAPHLAVEAGLFTLVASAGETSLYRIDQCGEL